MSNEINCNGRHPSLPSLEVVKNSKPLQSNTVNSMDWLLHIYYARQDFVACKKLIDQQLNVQLNQEYLYFVRGLISRHEHNYYEALQDFQKAIDLNSSNVENYKEIGKTLYLMGRFSQSLKVFREAETLSKRADHEIYHYIGEILYRDSTNQNEVSLARLNESKEYFIKAVNFGKKLESFQKLASIYRKEKNYGKAIEVLENCLQLAPENTDVLTEISVLYLKINETQRAFDKLLEVNDIDENCPKGLLAFGAILQSRNDVEGAISKYKQIKGSEVETTELWNNIGLCFYKKQKYILATACLRKSIWISPLNYNSLYNLSLIYVAAKQYASAFHTLAAAINLRKDSAECYMLLGICLRKLGDYDNAFTAFERSTALLTTTATGKNSLIYLNVALFSYEIGKIDAAAINFNHFVNDSKELVLSTEYKFQATKLKALLQQVSGSGSAIVDDPLSNLNSSECQQPFQGNDMAVDTIRTENAECTALAPTEESGATSATAAAANFNGNPNY